MNPGTPTINALPAVLRAFVQRHRLPQEAVRPPGRLFLTLDERLRLQVVPAPHQRLALLADLLPLAQRAHAAEDECLLRLARTAAALLQQQAATLCIDEDREVLMLQQLLPAGTDLAALEAALGEFGNALSFWHSLCEEAAAVSLRA